MQAEKKRRVKNSIPRLVFVALSLLFQIGWLMILILRLNEYSVWISLLTSVLSLVAVLRLYSQRTTAAMKMPWIMLILAFPVMGLSLFLLIEVFGDLGSNGKRLRTIRAKLQQKLYQDHGTFTRLEESDRGAANQSRYLLENAGYPVYRNTDVTYYGDCADALEAMKRDLEQAESFIFMEYFIVRECSAFQELRQILERKAKEGVEVRFMYDDIGSVGYVSLDFARKLNDAGIKCTVFNPALPVLNLFMNHRDHRKITVIDGRVGYTGGYNLSDEYFGRTFPYGQWKDTGLRMEGEAVRSLTAAFLEMWQVSTREESDGGRYLDVTHSVSAAEGFVQPFGDDPLEQERVAENVYLNLAAGAQKTLYFMTPYLVITDEMSSALSVAAKRGVDVRIITPGIPDKKAVYAITRSYYAGLAAQGVRIFEYTPGFCHAKQCICDGKTVSIGTSNLDFRSLYHHFENNVLLHDCGAVKAVAADFEETFGCCREVTDQYRSGRKAFLRIWQCLLRLFAPLV
ncbi:MAG: cardiolipin synthase [Oscillospiraceae bacterium]|nr:cardiolipin synthase [Oscillospiraceae bacterium]